MPYSAIIGGVGSIYTSAINAAVNEKMQEKQMAHDKEIAAINQSHVLQQMRVANQYQVNQFDRENSYNDPAAVRARYESAGINAAAAFGSGSASGAGIAAGLSSAPSGSSTGHSSNIMPGNIMPDIGGTLSTALTASQRIEAQNKKDLAESELATQKAMTEKFNREFISPLELQLKSALIDKTMNEGERIEVQTAIDRVTLKYQSAMEEINLQSASAGIDKTFAEISRIQQEIRKMVSDMKLNAKQCEYLNAQIDESAERVKKSIFERDFIIAQTQTEYTKQDLMEAQKACAEASKGHTEKLIEVCDAQIDLYASKMKLNDAQIERWKEKTRLEISKETREWTHGTMKQVNEFIGALVPFI